MSAAPTRAEAPSGDLPAVPGYRIARALGRGGQAVVFLATTDDDLEKEVALKYFPPLGRNVYRRELQTARAIEAARRETRCEHLVEGYAAGELPDGAAFIAMTYYARGSLADAVRERGPLPEPEALGHIRAALAAVGVLHERGLVHDDVKPSNLFVGADGVTALGDFGLARGLDQSATGGGTPAFAAPEVFLGAPRANRIAADLYSVGATLYFLLTGKPPFPGRPDLFELERHGVPRPLQRTLLRALREEPDARFPSAEALRAALAEDERRISSRRTAIATPDHGAIPGRAARPAAAARGIALAAIAVGALVAFTAIAASVGPFGGPPADDVGATSAVADSTTPPPTVPPVAAPAPAATREASFAASTVVLRDARSNVIVLTDGRAPRALGPSRCVAVTPDGRAVIAPPDGSVVLEGDAPVRPHADAVVALAAGFDADGAAVVASASVAGAVVLLRERDGALEPAEARLAADGWTGIVSLALSADGARLAVGRIATGAGAPPPRVAVHRIDGDGVVAAPILERELPPFAGVVFLGDAALAVGLLDGQIATVAIDDDGAGSPTLARVFAASIEWLALRPDGHVIALGDDRVSRVVNAGEAPRPDEMIVLDDDERRVLWPREPRRVVRVLDGAKLAKGQLEVRSEPERLP